MIPGINNLASVGSRPTCRIGKVIVSNASTTLISPLASANNTKHTFDGIGHEAVGAASKTKETKVSHVTSLRYNTITNPIPLLTQNPYINREITMAATKQRINI